jgi:ATP-dependent protease Clp ATPase subunit
MLEHACSFCAKTEHDVAVLIEGPDARICDECVALAADIVAARLDQRVQIGAVDV